MADRQANPNLGDFQKMADDMYRQWEQSLGAWWDQVLDSPAFLGGMGENLAGMARAREQYESNVDEQMARLHLPTRGDLTRLARIATLLEKRLLETEDRVLELRDAIAEQNARLASIEKEALQARLDAGEARLELRERLGAIEARLAALDGMAPAARRARKAAGEKA